MNSENKFLKIFFIVAFLLLMVISSWATVESLHLLLPEWPVVFFWAISLIFFFLASYGVKLMTDSFNQNKFIERRLWKLLGGVVLVIIFWIFFSLPTNTHTFFYKAKAKQVLTDEISYTKGKLIDLKNTKDAKIIIDNDKRAFERNVENTFTAFEHEINNRQNRGLGPKADSILIDLDNLLGGKLTRLTLKSTGRSDIKAYLKDMKAQKDTMKAVKLKEYDQRLASVTSKEVQKEIGELKNYFKNIQENMTKNPANNEPTQLTINNLVRAFRVINKYSDDLNKIYPTKTKSLLDYPTPKTIQLYSVVDVWKSFFKGKYTGEGFLYWIIVAILIDIAGFLMFALGFRSDD